MAIPYCVEPYYRNTPWCAETLAGLEAEVKRRKLELALVEDLAGWEAAPGVGCVMLIGSLRSWILDSVQAVSQKRLHPIVISNTPVQTSNKRYSNISSDISGALCSAMSLIPRRGKRMLLYGINPASFSDEQRRLAFLEQGGAQEDIICNHGSLKACFYALYNNISLYDTVICANDYAAVSLVTRLKKANYPLEELNIISCLDGVLAAHMQPAITSFAVNFAAFGKAAMSVYDAVNKNKSISSVDIRVQYVPVLRQTTPNAAADPAPAAEIPPESKPEINIYKDTELMDIIRIERFFRKCDPVDLGILQGCADGLTYSDIAQSCFISVSAVKYRVKNLCGHAGVANSRQLLSLLAPYLSKAEVTE